ncbi:MAG: DNA internalization-related competence protein ComEC/Rec2, partial [Thiohalomonadales bacterium]
MQLIAIGLLTGCSFLLQFSDLPHIAWVSLAVVSIPVAIKWPLFRFASAVTLGFAWALMFASIDLGDRIPLSLEKVDLLVTGKVIGLPHRSETSTRFEFLTQSVFIIDPASHTDPTVAHFQANRRLRLTWYNDAPALLSGEVWQLHLRLKRPRGFMNPGGFDYEAWLFRRGIDAVGYVYGGKNNRLGDESVANLRLKSADGWSLDHWRQAFISVLDQGLQGAASAGLVKALIVGDRSGITPQQWQTMSDTGTNHLMAISGLHIGMVAGFVFFLVRWAWAATPFLVRRYPAQKSAALAAVLAALVYAGLAGFTIPTQRAFLMVAIAMLSLLLLRRILPGQYLAYALIGVLMIDPFAPMDTGFWLSFGAVTVLIIGMSNRWAMRGIWWYWGRAQWVVFIGLLPFIAYYFAKIPLSSPIANIIAIPWVTFVTVPLSLLSALFLLIPVTVDSNGFFLLQWSSLTLDGLWPILEWLQDGIPTYPMIVSSGPWAISMAVVGVLLLLLPRGLPARWIGLLWMVPLFWPCAEKLSPGELKMTVLDVGQGLSVVVETANHVLLYDTGAKFSDRFDAVTAAVLPYLRHQGVAQIDTLVLSHNDGDHVGARESLFGSIAIDQIISGRVPALHQEELRPCYRGQVWVWDQVRFEVLHPPLSAFTGMRKDNNQSCV